MPKARIGVGLVVFLTAAVAGYMVARPLAPERLRVELEQRLSELLGGEVHIAQLRLSPSLGLRLEGTGVEVWRGGEAPAFRAERIRADVRAFSHLTGQRRLRRLRIEGARMRVVRAPDGRWSPPPAAALFGQGQVPEPVTLEADLQPLSALETAARFLLTQPLVADTVELSDAALVLTDGQAPGAQGNPLNIERIQAELHQRPLLGDTRLRLRGRLRDSAGDRGTFESEGRLSRSGELRMAVALTDLELDALTPYLRNLRPHARLAGRLSGAVALEADRPGRGRLEVDLVGHEMYSDLPDSLDAKRDPLAAERAELKATLEISPEQLRLTGARFNSERLGLELDAVLGRPFHGGSQAELTLAARDVSLTEARHLIGWLPEIEREEAEAVVAPLEIGRLRSLRAGGSATLSAWQSFLAGRSRELPRNFVVDVELEDTTLRAGDSDLIEGLSGRLWWTGDRIEVRRAQARLNGKPLPMLDLSIRGASQLFAASPEARKLHSGAPPLSGLRPLWQVLRGEPGGGPARIPTVSLKIQRLEHPMFLWPIADALAVIEPIEGGVRIETAGGTWAGVPVEGEADWVFEPEERVRAQLALGAPRAPASVPGDAGGSGWTQGSFELGAFEAGAWRHEKVRGSFEAEGGVLRLHDAVLDLAPSGRGLASARLDLSRHDAVPYGLSFALTDGDLSAVAALVGLPAEMASGDVDLWGSLDGELAPGIPLHKTLSGLLDIEAREGTIRRAVPAVMAVAMASEVFNPFSKREQIRFERIETLLRFEEGWVRSDSFAMDGPDVRAFASGSVDIARPPHQTDVEMALFLFRPVDSVIQKIPILNVLLLGPNRNLLAAHMRMQGPWDDPEATLSPLRSLATGPGSLVFETLPALVARGLRMLDSLFSRERVAGQEGEEPPPG